MSRRMRILTTLLVVVVGSIVLWKTTAAKLEQEAGQVSDDSLSQGIAERWGGGLPAGFTKEEADDLERTGHLFARLTYTAAVEDLLEAWEPAAPEVADEFQNLMDAHRSDQGQALRLPSRQQRGVGRLEKANIVGSDAQAAQQLMDPRNHKDSDSSRAASCVSRPANSLR